MQGDNHFILSGPSPDEATALMLVRHCQSSKSARQNRCPRPVED